MVYRKGLTLLLSLFLGIHTSPLFACTNLIAGKNATMDGSVLLTYAADSHSLYGELYHWPAQTWPTGSVLDVREWDTGKYLGQISQVKHTYSVVGNMNEHQLTIAETTFGGRPELVDSTGIMDYGSLIYIALQRAKTAREAIKVMTELVRDYGYYSSGESFSIADPNEAWIMEMIGKGTDYKGAVWVAVRIPDDCVAAHANQARIRQFPLNDPENCLFAPDVITFARQMGYFDGINKDFSFADAYAPLDFMALRACEARVWSFFRKADPTMDRYLPYILGESPDAMPLFIKPNRKLSAQDFKNFMRDHYEDTPLDMTQDAGAGPYKVPYRWRPMTFTVDSVEYLNERAIATQQTGFSFVAQMRNWLPDPIGGILWFGVDDANTSVYVPMYCGITEIPMCFKVGNGDLLNFSWTSAFWIYNWVSNMTYQRYNQMIKDVRPIQTAIEEQFVKDVLAMDILAREAHQKDPTTVTDRLTAFSMDRAEQSTARWKKLGEYLMVKYLDGNVKKEANGRFLRNPYGLPASPEFPGYDDTYYRSIVEDAGTKLKIKKSIHEN
ncbi:MAG: C69 family dipeptidase [Bacteroidales bacterium]|nr:C69 family dipeptidase [Bacteroidales bacterium]MDD4770297.1 C69 family dipeptidase [Bacteroidales bacterium]